MNWPRIRFSLCTAILLNVLFGVLLFANIRWQDRGVINSNSDPRVPPNTHLLVRGWPVAFDRKPNLNRRRLIHVGWYYAAIFINALFGIFIAILFGYFFETILFGKRKKHKE